MLDVWGTADCTMQIACTCGWGGPAHYPGVTTGELRSDHYDHVHGLPGYVQYYRRPVSWDD